MTQNKRTPSAQAVCLAYADTAGWGDNSQLALTFTFLDSLESPEIIEKYRAFLAEQMHDEMREVPSPNPMGKVSK